MTLLSPATLGFLTALRANNDRDWFNAHKDEYLAAFKHPAESFAAALESELGERLGAPMQAKVFRLHRDVRFSKDKTPYNSHLRIALSPGGEGGPLWMFGIDPDGTTVGMGSFEFAPRQLERWRGHVASSEGAATAGLIERCRSEGIRFGEPDLKRVPAPFAQDHPQAALLRHKGLTAWIDLADPALVFGPAGPAACAGELMRLRELHDRLCAIVLE